MHRMTSLLTVCWFAIAAPSHAATIVHAGRLIDGKSGEAKTEMSIVVEDGRITKVASGYVAPAAGDKVIRLVSYKYLGNQVQIIQADVVYRPDGSIDKYQESTRYEHENKR